MATATRTVAGHDNSEAQFFVSMSLTVLGIVLLGFGVQGWRIGSGYFDLPRSVLLHGLLFISWCLMATVQPFWIVKRRLSLHRRLGWAGALLAAAMTVSGITLTFHAVANNFFAPFGGVFLAINTLTILAFLAMAGVGVALRRRTDWHRRLLMCATIVLTYQAWSRILPMQLLGPTGLAVIGILALALVGWGAIRDKRALGKVHPAWKWGAAAIAAPAILAPPIGLSMPVVGLVSKLNETG